MIKTADETVHNYARENLRAFLEGKQNLKWFVGVIRSSGVEGASLAEIFESLRGNSNSQRYEEAVRACRQAGLLP